MAALLAQQKFVATREFLTAADGGLFHTYSSGGRPQSVTEGLGTRWELENIALRLWPSASTIQGFITAMFDLVEQHGLRLDQVRTLRVSLGKTAVDMHGIFPRYQGKFEALLSTHYCAAAILQDQALTLAQFEAARYNDPALARFAAEQVEIKSDPALSGVQCAVEAQTRDGRTLSVRCDHPRGSPENPLSRAEIEDKFRTYARALLAATAVEEAVGAISKLEDLRSARRLMDLLRTGGEARARKSA
jgi:2-methylcitrate dehydratase PrpD